MTMKKICLKCNKKLDLSFFWKKNQSKDGLDTYCKECRKIIQNKWLNENKEKRIKSRKKWYLKNKKFLSVKAKKWRKNNPILNKERNKKYHRKYSLKKRYGLTENNFNELFHSQKGKCAICGFIGDLGVDHNHQTNQVRGLLCNKCNIKLGFYEDNLFSEKAAKYLSIFEKH